MSSVLATITRFVDDHFPGFVELLLVDAAGHSHLFVEKIPVVTLEDLNAESTYPCSCTIACRIEREWTDLEGRALAEVNTELPWGIDSTTGQHRFVVLASQITNSGVA